MVICLKVKTLDSQTYDFSVDNEISVRQFKETIAERTNISADLQRIIYCGRVLVDENLLKEYDVNGKVVHVVERPPPSARSTTNSGDGTNRRQRDGLEGNIRGSPIFRALDGMVVGAMTIPVNPNAGTAPPTAQSLNPSSSFCMNRITVARHMLECANNIASYLENPERGLNNSSLDILTQGRWTMESTVVEVGISAAGNVEIPQNQTQNIVEALHGAVSAALRQNGQNVTVVQLPTVFGSNGSSLMSASQPITGPNPAATESQQNDLGSDSQNSNTTETSNTTDPVNENQQQERDRMGNASNNPNSESPTSGRQRTGTRVLAEVVHQMRNVQTRLEPFFQQYYDILLNDPVFDENDNAGRENAQRIYDRVSEALHYLSHAQHAISDLMLDMSQNTPRYLCCRPILVEQSGFVSSNNYLASFLQPNGNNNETTATNNNPMTINLTPPSTNQTENALPLNGSNISMMTIPPFTRVTIPLQHQSHEDHDDQQISGNGQQSTNLISSGSMNDGNSDGSNTPQTPTTTPVQPQTPTTIPNSGQQQQLGQSPQIQQQQPLPPPANINATGLHRILSPLFIPRAHMNTSTTPINSNTENGQESQPTAEIVFTLPPSRILFPNPQLQVARLIQAVVNSAPVDADVHVQINAPNLLTFGLPMQSSQQQQQQQQTNQSTPGTQNQSPASTTASTPQSTTANGGNNVNVQNSNNSTNDGANQNQSESNQPRVTTATHPTTSTQTRSTARPQVHVANLPSSQMWNARVIPANMLSSFDRFLPCSSHHIRDSDLSDVHNTTPHNQNIFTRARNHQMRNQRQNRNQQQTPTLFPVASSTIITAATAPAESSTASTPRSTTTTQPPSSTRSSSTSEDIFNLSNDDFNTPINLFGSNLTLRDLIDIAPSPNTLNRIRTELHTFIVDNLFAGAEINNNNMNDAINQVIQLLNNALVFLPQFDLPDYDSRASVENFIRNTLPFIFNLIRDDESNEFGTRLLRELISFVRRLFVILVTCVGRSNAALYLNQITQMTITSNNELEQEALRALQRHLMVAVIRELDLTRQNTNEVQEFLVIRRPSPEQNQTTNPTPMETDDLITSEQSIQQTISNQNSLQSSQQKVQDQLPVPTPISGTNEPLPSVVVGSESWHNNFPSTWLPIITRDIERQRRQSPQGSFSDAYISGMSAKRRKLITNSKPQTDVTSLLSEGVRRALQTVNGGPNPSNAGGFAGGGGTGTGLLNGGNNTNAISFDEVSAAISADPIAQTSYCEALRSNLQERLKTDPDYKADKFPNISKYFNK